MGDETRELLTSPAELVEELRDLRRLEAEKHDLPASSRRFQQLVAAIGDKSRRIMQRTILRREPQHETPGRYGPKTPEVMGLIDRVRHLTAAEGAAIRHGYVTNESPSQTAGVTRAAVTLVIIRAAVNAGLKDEHRRAIVDCRQALAASKARENGMGVHLGDLAGALVVRERLDPSQFAFMASGWGPRGPRWSSRKWSEVIALTVPRRTGILPTRRSAAEVGSRVQHRLRPVSQRGSPSTVIR